MTDRDTAWLDDPAVLRRLAIHMKYTGPFERVMNWLWCLDPVTCEITREVPDGSLRGWLACRAEFLDRAWREWHVRHRMPPDRWLRKLRPPDRWLRKLRPPDDEEFRENPVNPRSSYGRDEELSRSGCDFTCSRCGLSGSARWMVSHGHRRWSSFLLAWLGDWSALMSPRHQLAGKRLWEPAGGKHRRRAP